MSRKGKRRYLICYDIKSPRRLARIARLCTRHAVRLQYSVFEAWLSAAERHQLQHALMALIDPAQDDIRIYGLSDTAELILLGRAPLMDDVLWSPAL